MSKNNILVKDFFNVINNEFKNNIIDPPMEIGKITSINPLIIDLGGLPLYEDNLYINRYLLPWDEEVDVTTTVVQGHSHKVLLIHHPSKLKVGYYVGLYGLEWDETGKTYQKYHLIDVIK
jgi:hypothetical protein